MCFTTYYKRIQIALCFMPAVLLSGCGLFQKPKPVIQVVDNDTTMVRLNHIAEKAERSTRVLAQIQNAEANSTITLQGARHVKLAMTATPQGWGKRVSVNFEGPFNKLLNTLALKANYQYFEQGRRPANLPLVVINARLKTAKQILDQVVSQLPQTIAITVYPRTWSFIVTYGRGK